MKHLSRLSADLSREAPALYQRLLAVEEQEGAHLVTLEAVLEEGLADQNMGVRQQAATYLGRLADTHDPEAVPAVVRMLAFSALSQALKDDSLPVRVSVVEALRHHHTYGEEVVRLLLAAVNDQDAAVRKAGVEGLCHFNLEGTAEAVKHLIGAMGDQNTDVRRGAIQSLIGCGVDAAGEAVPELIKALKDQDPGVRNQAILTLAWLAPEAVEAVPGLAAVALKDNKEAIRGQAAQALVRIDCAEGTSVTGAVKNGAMRKGLIRELRRLGKPGRTLRKKLQAVQTTEPAEAARPEVRTITISSGEDGIYSLQANGAQPLAVPDREGWNKVLSPLAQKVRKGCPTEWVSWQSLNHEMDPTQKAPPKTASTLVRQVLKELNKYLRDHLGPPPKGRRWLEGTKGSGVRLNPSTQWTLSPRLKKELGGRSVYDHATDPTIIDEANPQHEQKLPARARGGKLREIGEDDN